MQRDRVPVHGGPYGEKTGSAADGRKQYEPVRDGFYGIGRSRGRRHHKSIGFGPDSHDPCGDFTGCDSVRFEPSWPYFPLRSGENGVFERVGHMEGCVDLVKMALLSPFSVSCELTNVDGSMARWPKIRAFSEKHGFPVVTIADIEAFRSSNPAVTETEITGKQRSALAKWK